jgi:hypothetical protein
MRYIFKKDFHAVYSLNFRDETMRIRRMNCVDPYRTRKKLFEAIIYVKSPQIQTLNLKQKSTIF